MTVGFQGDIIQVNETGKKEKKTKQNTKLKLIKINLFRCVCVCVFLCFLYMQILERWPRNKVQSRINKMKKAIKKYSNMSRERERERLEIGFRDKAAKNGSIHFSVVKANNFWFELKQLKKIIKI